MNHGFRRELEAGLQAVRQAALLCRQVQSGITTESLAKRDNSPVTVADYGSQAVICRLLAAEFPQDPVIGEEGAAELRTSEEPRFCSRFWTCVLSTGLREHRMMYAAGWIMAVHHSTQHVSGHWTRSTEPRDFCGRSSTRFRWL